MPGRIRGSVLLYCGPLLRPRPVTQLRGAPALFRDVLIKQHVEPENRTAAETRTVTQCLSAQGPTDVYLADNMAASKSSAKNSQVIDAVAILAWGFFGGMVLY